MSIIDLVLSIIISLLNNIAGVLPVEFSRLSVNDFINNMFRGLATISGGFGFIETFFPVKLLFLYFTIILFCEVLGSFVIKGIFWLIRTVRGG
jgi:hypothetical protein